MLVFRKTQVRIAGGVLRRDLHARVAGLHAPSNDTLVPLLLRAGEVEAALEDANHDAAPASRNLTSAVARALADGAEAPSIPELSPLVEGIELPDEIALRRPEGYAYYALDPLDYSRLASGVTPKCGRVTVLGVRSIGTSLSAVVDATLRTRGFDVKRATVRPTGHPGDRRTIPEPFAEQTICERRDGEFMVVDEGPGASGSSFLSVGEALVERGVPSERITFLCSRRVDPARLAAKDAEQRWSRFQATTLDARPKRDSEIDLCAGLWRQFSQSRRESWPPSWKDRERAKYLSADGSELRRFVGHSPYGEGAVGRAELLALGGFSPKVLGYADGYLRQRWESGRYFPLSSVRPVERIAEYLAFRTRAFPVREASFELEGMLRNNVLKATGKDLDTDVRLEVVTPTLCDGSLAPHEWLLTDDGRVLKTDSSDHGDDHLYPGPCDSAWDLAGAVVEWDFNASERRRLLSAYRRETGDDATQRLPAYELAYAAFRIGCMRTAKLSADSADAAALSELEAAYERHLHGRLNGSLGATPAD